MILKSSTFEAVTEAVEKILREDFRKSSETIRRNKFNWRKLLLFMEEEKSVSIDKVVCDNFLNKSWKITILNLSRIKIGRLFILSPCLNNILFTGKFYQTRSNSLLMEKLDIL